MKGEAVVLCFGALLLYTVKMFCSYCFNKDTTSQYLGRMRLGRRARLRDPGKKDGGVITQTQKKQMIMLC